MTSATLAPVFPDFDLERAFAIRVEALTERLGRAPIILTDMDGVLYEWGAQLNRVLQMLDPSFPIVPDRYRTGFGHLSGPNANTTVLKWALEHPHLYTHGTMTPSADAALAIMRDIGLDVLLCTTPAWKNPAAYNGKRDFAVDNFGDWVGEALVFTHDKTLVFGDVIIDDKPGITGRHTPSWDHIVFDRSYNEGYDTGHRIHGWHGYGWLEALLTTLEARD